ncbi:helix-turn-helix transcriptional regulator [Chitinophaga sp. SYP-B3965]|uniref:helix-turn-helix transcriptional regulator n=1 Tax=Chitinophaga sp. SYP-B3965 TaxID=2663120 RepID=UPI0015630BB5|nr:helix-turn-helix transcriptional regulator [Chitinophaga sp. SYP-B3965]
MKDLSKKLFLLRALHQLTQKGVADEIGVSTTIYGGLEKDASSIPIKRLERIVAIYGLTLENLFAFDEKDLIALMKGKTPNSLLEEFLPELVSKMDAINKLLCQLVQHSILQIEILSRNRPGLG